MKTIVMCDLDGVLADNRHRLHYLEAKDYENFYSYKEVLSDSEIPLGDSLLCTLTSEEDTVLYFVTGRNESCKYATLNWLWRNAWDVTLAGRPTYLEMRAQDDRRPSPEVKVELVAEILDRMSGVKSPNYIFIDDDPENVRAVTEKFPFVCGLVFGTERIK